MFFTILFINLLDTSYTKNAILANTIYLRSRNQASILFYKTKTKKKIFMKRKDFIKSSAILATSAFFLKSKGAILNGPKIRVGLIGVNGMGWANLNALLKNSNVVCTALCDVDQNVLKKRTGELAQRDITVKTYVDYKNMLQDEVVDAVIIATPDHWHCLQMIDAVAAGKHVYVEKPVANSIKECEAMVAAALKHNSIVQVGQWQRSQQHFQDAISFVHSGKLGNIRMAKAWAYLGWKKRVPVLPDSEVPEGVDYLAWQGPAKHYPFNPNRFHYNFRWYWDYAGGLMTDWGVHLLDYALLGMRAELPKSVMATGGKFAYPDDAGDTPDTMTAIYEFDNFNIVWEHATSISNGFYGREHGIAFIGDNGTLVLDRGGWEVIPDNKRMEAVPLQRVQDNGLEKHMDNFVDAIVKKDRNILKAPIEAGAHIAIFSQMANIAYKTGQKLDWDSSKRKFTDKKANKLLAATYHNGYHIPKV